VKRVRGMRLITPAWQEKAAREKQRLGRRRQAQRARARPGRPRTILRVVK
jgi:hypothetical protein